MLGETCGAWKTHIFPYTYKTGLGGLLFTPWVVNLWPSRYCWATTHVSPANLTDVAGNGSCTSPKSGGH